jgi:hypothetical protein
MQECGDPADRAQVVAAIARNFARVFERHVEKI